MASPEVVRPQRLAAGFEDVQFARHDCSIMMGADVEQARVLQVAIGPAGAVGREAGEQAQRLRPRVEEALRGAGALYDGARRDHALELVETITARKPGA
jgi:hypothetical protein